MRKLAIFSFSFAAAAAVWMYSDAALWPVIAAGVICVLSFALVKGESRTRVTLAAAGAAAGFLWVFAYGLIFYQPAADMAGETAEISCEVLDFSEINDYGTYVRVKIFTDGPDITSLLYLDGCEELEPGDKIDVYAYLALADRMSGEETDYYRSEGIYLRAYQEAEDGYVTGISRGESVPLPYIPAHIAKAVKNKVLEIFPGDVAGFITAILTGERSLIEDDEYSDLQTSGAAHVVAVSGMHVSFLVGLMMTLTGRRKHMSLICIPILILFMAIVGFTPSVVRAGIMQIFVLMAPVLGREQDTMTSLSAALLLLLVVNPYSVSSVGLQLSFASVLGINTISPKLGKRIGSAITVRNKIALRVILFVADSFSISVGAMILTIPVMAVSFEYISVYAPLTNLLVLWAVSIVFSVAIIACLAGFLIPVLGIVIAFPVSLLVRYIIGVSALVSELPGALLYTLSNYIRIWLAVSYILFTVFYFVPGGDKRDYIPVSLCASLFCLCFLLTSFDAYGSDMEITVLDVGQGQSVVITTGEHTVVVDCGSEGRGTAGERAAKYLFGKNIFYLDVLVLTHFDADHVNGVTDLLDRVEVGRIVIPEPCGEDKSYVSDILTAAESLDVDVCYVTSDMVFYMGESELTVYAPVGSGSDNDSGLSVVETCGEFDVLITGDMSDSLERRLVKLKDLPDVEVIVVGHHGSKHSSSEELLEEVKADLAIISVGASNSYGHPTEEAMTRLEKYGAHIFRTDQAGDVTVKAR